MAGRASVLVVALALAACSTNPAPQPAPTPPGPLSNPSIGLNDGFHGPLPPDVVAHYATYKAGTVIRTPQLSKVSLEAFLASVASVPVQVIALIEGQDATLGHDFSALPLAAIENGNELELPPHNLTAQQYAFVQGTMHDAERAAGFTGQIIMGGVYALTDETKQAITLALARCADCLIGVHLYTITRQDIDWLNAQQADVALTETGSPTNCDPAKLTAQAAYQHDLYDAAVQIHRLKYFLVYQGGDGPSCSNLDTFGIRNKPAESFF